LTVDFRGVEHAGNLFDRQPREIAQLDDLSLTRIQRRQFRQRLVQRQHVDRVDARRRRGDTANRYRIAFRTFPLRRATAAGVVDQHAAHHPRRDAKEVRAIFPGDLTLRQQP